MAEKTFARVLKSHTALLLVLFLHGCGFEANSALQSHNSNHLDVNQPRYGGNFLIDTSGFQPVLVKKRAALACDQLPEAQIVFEAAESIGIFCREQNALLGERGCGVGSTFCPEELLLEDRPGPTLTVGLSVSSGVWKSDYAYEDRWDTTIVSARGNSRVRRGTYRSSWSDEENYLDFGILIGIEIPLGPKELRKTRCVNPLFQGYVRKVVQEAMPSDEVLKARFAECQRQSL